MAFDFSFRMVTVALLVAPTVYILIHIVAFLKRVRKSKQAVLQWPGLPVHWLYGNFHQVSFKTVLNYLLLLYSFYKVLFQSDHSAV